jgi:cyclopropane fatty-acyl-phospholipid synthase-like methyltransferase
MRKVFYCLLDILLLRAWHVKKTLKEVSANMKDSATILDAGCGFGQYTWRMQKMNKNLRIKGVDIDSEHIGECDSFFTRAGLTDRVSFQTMDLTALNDTDCYDIILSVDVMEHIKEDVKVFRNFHNALKKNGVFIISTPSDKGGSDVHSENDTSFVEEHVRNGYSIEEITEKLSNAGFGHIEAKYTYGNAGHISWLLSMKYPIKMLNISSFFFVILPLWYLIFFPVMLILNYVDVNSTHKTGTGLLVTAVK